MTRDKERQQAADNYVGHPQEVGEDLYINTSRKSFKNGAEWADEHPNPELKKQWIDKACDWLKEQEEYIGISFQEDFIERFKKAVN